MKLGDALGELGLEASPHVETEIEELLFRADQRGQLGVARDLGQGLRERDGFAAVALGLKTGLAHLELAKGLRDDAEIGPQHGFVQLHEDIAGLDDIAFLDLDGPYDPTGRMLHALDAQLGHELTRRDHCTGELGGRRPAAHAADQDERREAGHQKVAADRALGRGLWLGGGHQGFPCPSLTTRSAVSGAGCGACLVT